VVQTAKTAAGSIRDQTSEVGLEAVSGNGGGRRSNKKNGGFRGIPAIFQVEVIVAAFPQEVILGRKKVWNRAPKGRMDKFRK